MQAFKDSAIQSGSLLQDIAAPYTFTITEVFQEAWLPTPGFNSTVLAAAIDYCLRSNKFQHYLIYELSQNNGSITGPYNRQ